ncbi:putative integrase [Stygiolobus sp. CP859M]
MYFVYFAEKDDGHKQRHHYIVTLEKVIEFYISIGGGGYPPQR